MSGPKPQPRDEAFNERYMPEPNSGCWIWIGNANRDGYGLLTGSRKGKPYFLAHRVSWEMHKGAIPDGLHVLHRCDMPACVNPDHLFLGTHSENMHDMGRKGRGRGKVMFGDDNPSRKYPEKRPRGDAHWTRRQSTGEAQ